MSKSKEIWKRDDLHEGRIKAIATTCQTNDGIPLVISGGEDRNIYILNAHTGELVRQIDKFNGRPGHPGHRDMIYVIKVWNLDSGEHRIISTGEDRLIRVFDLDTGRDVFTLPGHSDFVHSLVLLEDVSQLISSSYDRTIRLWDLTKREELRMIKQDKSLYGIAANLEAGCIASTSSNTINVWNISTGETKLDSILRIHKRTVVKLAWPRPDLLISCSDDNMIGLWNPSNKEDPLLERLDHGSPAYSLDFYEDDKLFLMVTACFGKPNSLRVWDMEENKLIESYVGHLDKVTCVSALTDGSPIDPTRNDPGKKAKKKKKKKRRKKKKSADESGAEETEDEDDLDPPEFRRIASVSWDNTIRVWDFQPIIESLHRVKYKDAAQASRMV